jgi:hypothetical protein
LRFVELCTFLAPISLAREASLAGSASRAKEKSH